MEEYDYKKLGEKIVRSGIFKLDEDGYPIGLITLTPGKKALSNISFLENG